MDENLLRWLNELTEPHLRVPPPPPTFYLPTEPVPTFPPGPPLPLGEGGDSWSYLTTSAPASTRSFAMQDVLAAVEKARALVNANRPDFDALALTPTRYEQLKKALPNNAVSLDAFSVDRLYGVPLYVVNNQAEAEELARELAKQGTRLAYVG